MLQKLTDTFKNKTGAIIIALVGTALAWTGKGLGDRFNVDFGPEAAATVNGNRIEPKQALDAWRDVQLEMRGAGDRESDSDKKRYQDEVLERLVLSQLLTDRARSLGYRVDGGRIRTEIGSEAAFQVDGVYNETLALSRLAQIGITADQYRLEIQRSLESREVQQTTALSEFVTPVEYGRRVALEDEQRKVAVLDYPRDKYRAWVDKSEPKLQAWYAANGKRFTTTESVTLQLISASVPDLLAAITVSEDELKAAYAKNLDRYQQAERRQVRHILLKDEKTANEVLAKLRGGADFAAVAQTSSIDTVSAAAGGDLGLSEKGAFVPAFADVAFAAKVGELRGPVKTEFGFHIIKVDSIETGRSKTFDEVRGELEGELKREIASQRLANQEDEIQKLATAPGADLDKIATQYSLKSRTVQPFLRGTGGGDLSGEAALIEAAFSDEALVQRRVVGPVAFGSEGFAVIKVLDHQKPQVPPLAAIRDAVLSAYVTEQADALALAAAKEVADKVTQGEFRAPVAGRFVDRRDPSLAAPQRKAAFDLARPAAGRPLAAAVKNEAGGASVVIVEESRPVAGGVDSALKALRMQSQQVGTAQSMLGAYLRDLRAKAEVTKHPEVFTN